MNSNCINDNNGGIISEKSHSPFYDPSVGRFRTEAELEDLRLRDLELLGRSNFSIDEDPIIDLARTKSRELPIYIPPEISPIDELRSNAPKRGSNHQMSTSKITVKTTATERAKITCLATLSKHGKKTIEKEEFSKEILWDFSASKSECSPFWLRRFDGSPDVEIHSDHHVKANRSHCDNLGCSTPMCCDLSAREKASGVADKLSFVERLSTSSGGRSQRYHVFVSPPQDLGKKWMCYSGYFEEMSRIASVFMEVGLGMTAYSMAFHPWRGRKEKDRIEALQYVGGGSEENSSEISGNSYFWRLGPHFHVLGIVSGAVIKTQRYLHKLCKEIYRITGWVVHIKPVEEHPELVWKYVLTHVGLGQKAGSKRSLPAFRNFGLSSPRGINKIDLGHITKVRPCPKCGEMCNDLHGDLSSVRTKFNGYALKIDKKYVVSRVGSILGSSNWEVGKSELSALLHIPELFISKRSVPRYVVPPEEIHPEDFLPLEEDPPEEISSERPPEGMISDRTEQRVVVKKRSIGNIIDTLELMEFLDNVAVLSSASVTVGPRAVAERDPRGATATNSGKVRLSVLGGGRIDD